MKAHLEPYLGYLHDMEITRPSMVCDFMELYRHLIDDFLIKFCKPLKARDFKAKKYGKITKRVYLSDEKTSEMVRKLYKFFDKRVNIPSVKRGRRQKISTLISQEAHVIKRYLHGYEEEWKPRMAIL